MRRLFMALLCVTLCAVPVMAQSSHALQRARMAENEDTQARVMFLCMKVAIDVMQENARSCCGLDVESSVAAHMERARFAAQVIRDPLAVTRRVTLAVLTDSQVQGQSGDAEIEATLRAQWNAYAASMAR